MAYAQIPTRTSADANSAADVNQLEANIEAVKGGAGSAAPTTTIAALNCGTDKGDLIGFSGSGAPVKIAKSAANDYVLTAASGETGGVKWAAAAAGGGIQGITFFIPGSAYVAEHIQIVRVPKAFTISNVLISVLTTAPTGAALTVDVNYVAYVAVGTQPAPTTIFTTGPGTNRPSIMATEFSDTSGAPDVTAVAAGGFISVSIDVIGSTLPGTDLMVTVVAA
jgi:hypothetical protein